MKDIPTIPSLQTSLLDPNSIDEDNGEIDFEFEYVFKLNNGASEANKNPPLSGRFSTDPADHQHIVYLHSLCDSETTKQCIPYEMHLIEYYSEVKNKF